MYNITHMLVNNEILEQAGVVLQISKNLNFCKIQYLVQFIIFISTCSFYKYNMESKNLKTRS